MGEHQLARLLHPDDHHLPGAKYMRIPERVQKRADDAAREAGRYVVEQVAPMPQISTIINLRPRRDARVYPKNRYDPANMIKDMKATVDDIRGQAYDSQKTTNILAMVSGGLTKYCLERLEDHAEEKGIRTLIIAPGTAHPVAYNRALEMLETKNGLVWMTEAGFEMTNNQTFHAAAIGVANGASAVQGTCLATDKSGKLQAAVYNAATLMPKYAGHEPRNAKPGVGFLATNRSAISLEHLAVTPREEAWQGPFNPAFGNGGYDGELGSRLPSHVVMDLAASVLHTEVLVGEEMANQILDWRTYARPNRYIDPGI